MLSWFHSVTAYRTACFAFVNYSVQCALVSVGHGQKDERIVGRDVFLGFHLIALCLTSVSNWKLCAVPRSAASGYCLAAVKYFGAGAVGSIVRESSCGQG